MRSSMWTFTFAAAVLVTAVHPVAEAAPVRPSASSQRNLRRALSSLKRAERTLALAQKKKTAVRRVRALGPAKHALRWSRRFARRGLRNADAPTGAALHATMRRATRTLVDVLHREAIFWGLRQSFPRARRLLAEALSLSPKNKRLRTTQRHLEADAARDFSDNGRGSFEVNRIRQRRAAAGVPFRDRGRTRRR